MSVAKKLKWRRALSTLRYSYEELGYIKEASRDAAMDFEHHYRKFCAENNINISELDKQNESRIKELYGCHEIADNHASDQGEVHDPGDTSIIVHNNNSIEDEQYELTADEIAIHDAFSKLFKQVALKLHPDRIDNSLSDQETKLKVSMFQKAKQSYEDRKYYDLLEIAERLNIATPKNYDQQTRWMKRETKTVLQRISKEKNTYNYSFSEAETDEDKDKLIKKFIFQLFRIAV